MDPQITALLAASVHDRACTFSVGGLGALAEFHDDGPDVEVVREATGALTARSGRGALRIVPQGDLSALAYEALAASPDAWQCAIGILGPAAACGLGAREVLTELGPDREAIDPARAGELLFDLGSGLPHIEFCVRTSEPALIAHLRRAAGTAVVAPRHPVLDAIVEASPARVVRSRLARVEVYQPIDRVRTPSGPHTHLLPDLLAHRRTHSANVPLPRGTLPLLTVHPEHPLIDAEGRRHPFRESAWARFEALLERFGDARYVAEKRRLVAAVLAGEAPHEFARARSRVGRLAQRVALRQLGHRLPDPARRTPWLAHIRP